MTYNNIKPQVVVSMTSFPQAIVYAEKALRSILQGSVQPDKLVLYVTMAQFGENDMPESLLALEKECPIFEIRNYDNDIRSYRKLVPALRDFPEAIIVTVDDDVDYHKHMLRDLLAMYEQYPNAIIAHRAKHIALGKPYKKWKKYRWYHFLFKRIHIGYDILQTGVAGVLYPPHSLKADMIDEALFTQIAPSTDDIWFWSAAVANGYPVIPVPFGKNKPRGVGKPGDLSLKWHNFKRGVDRNVEAFNAICEHFPELKKKIESIK